MVLPPPAQLQRLEHAFDVCFSVLADGRCEKTSSALALLRPQSRPTIFIRTRDGHTTEEGSPARSAIIVLGRPETEALPQHLRELKSRLTGSGVLALPFQTVIATFARSVPTVWGRSPDLPLWPVPAAVKSVTAATLYHHIFEPRAATGGIGFVLGSTRPLEDGRYRDTIGRVATDYLR